MFLTPLISSSTKHSHIFLAECAAMRGHSAKKRLVCGEFGTRLRGKPVACRAETISKQRAVAHSKPSAKPATNFRER